MTSLIFKFTILLTRDLSISVFSGIIKFSPSIFKGLAKRRPTKRSSIVSSVIYTDITKDGSLKGVSLEQTVEFAKSIPHSVIASGGVSSLNDILKLVKQVSNGVQGVIVGRALYDKKFSFSEALQIIKEANS